MDRVLTPPVPVVVGPRPTPEEKKEVVWPEVRQDLNLYPAGDDANGNAIWHLHDPLANVFYQLEERDVELLAIIGQKNADEIADLANNYLKSQTTEKEVAELMEFLRDNNLVKGDDVQQAKYQERLLNFKHKYWWEMAMRNPLFVRIPLVNPDRFLEETLPLVRWLGSKWTFLALTIIGLTGIYLVSRQLDQFFATFLHFFNLSGLAVYLLVLFAVKILHELGHAYTAKAVGCRVPVIGVAFMVGWPILFTDTSDAWKLPDRRTRLRIGIAGVSVELAIAVISLFLWSIAPEGTLKSALFLLSTTTWLLSIFVNFNPLMRFDGYYIVSDLLDEPNMEQRSFNMAKWWLRERLFGLGIEPREEPRRVMVFYAFCVWIYRFLLFLGIALLIYGFFFKLAGILLLIAEIIYFIARPVFNELKAWWELRSEMRFNRTTKRTLTVIGLLMAILFVPWYSAVSTPATMVATHNELFLPVAGRLLERPQQQSVVQQGDTLFRFESPEISLKLEEAENRYKELGWMRSSLGFDPELRNEALVVTSELRTQNQLIRSLVEEQAQLNIKAPFRGEVVDINPELIIGDWFPPGYKLGAVVDPDQTKVVAYLPEEQLARVETGMTATFFPENLEHGVHDLVVERIEFVGTPQLDTLYLASTFGGDIAVREEQDGSLTTVQSQYRIELAFAENAPALSQVVRGTAVIDGHRESLFSQFRRRFVAVFIRETGF